MSKDDFANEENHWFHTIGLLIHFPKIKKKTGKTNSYESGWNKLVEREFGLLSTPDLLQGDSLSVPVLLGRDIGLFEHGYKPGSLVATVGLYHSILKQVFQQMI